MFFGIVRAWISVCSPCHRSRQIYTRSLFDFQAHFSHILDFWSKFSPGDSVKSDWYYQQNLALIQSKIMENIFLSGIGCECRYALTYISLFFTSLDSSSRCPWSLGTFKMPGLKHVWNIFHVIEKISSLFWFD